MRTDVLSTGLIFCLGLAVSTQLACGDKDPGSDDSDSGVGGDAGTDGGADGGSGDGGADGGSGDGGTEFISGTVTGTVDVQFFTEADDGEREYIAWADTPWAKDFPFGSIFVAATQDNDAGGLTYRGNATVLSPSVEGDLYTMNVALPEDGEVQVYATLDLYGDGILSTDEPFGIYPGIVLVEDGGDVGNANITILVDYDEFYAWWSGGGGGGGGGCDTIEVSGTASLTSPWTDGDVAVMLFDLGNNGPYYYDRRQPTEVGGGAEAPFDMDVCVGKGSMKLRGAWDSNGNGLIDPADLWGAYVSSPDVDANPIELGNTDQTGLLVQIPMGSGEAGLSLTPFVSLSGSVTVSSGSFDDLDPASVVYMAALMYRPTGDFTVADIAEYSYDTTVWTSADYAGATSLPFTAWVPAGTIVYLWAYVDEGPKPDGIVNQVGELVASIGSDANGRLPTGDSSSSGYVLDLGVAR